MKMKFAFLILEEHPYGREMLRILLENDQIPGIIIQEVSTVGDIERGKFLKRINGQPVPPRLNEIVNGKDIPVYCVQNHNDAVSLKLLQTVNPDLLVLGGTRIIKPNILQVPKIGAINSHPGLLPELRGSASVGWALYKDLPMGATAHFIDPGIDTGDIIVKRELKVSRNDSYESLNYRIGLLSGQLMSDAISYIETGSPPRQTQDLTIGETYRVIPDELLEEAILRLANGKYSHYCD